MNKLAEILRSLAGKLFGMAHRLNWYASQLDKKAREIRHAKK